MEKPSPTASKEEIIDWFKNSYLKENSVADVIGVIDADLKHNETFNTNFTRDIIFALIKTGEYALHIDSKDRQLVYPNPDYLLTQSVDKTNKSVRITNITMVAFTAGLFMTSLVTMVREFQKQEVISTETQQIWQMQTRELDSIKQTLRRVDKSIQSLSDSVR